MGKPLRVLVVEDSEDDALLLMRELQRGGFEPVFERVAAEEEMISAITNQTWDIIISDYVMPHFSGLEALRVLQKSGRDLPFIIVSGKVSEELAVEAMKAGAHDYMSKNNLKRFVPAVERELGEAKMRRERRQTEKALKNSEASYRAIFDSANDAISLHDPENGKILDVNRKMCEMYSYTYDETLKIDIETISEGKPPYSQKEAAEWLRKAFEIGPQLFEWRAKDRYGRLFWVETNLKLAVIGGEKRILAIVRDITERKRAEEAQRVSEARYRRLFESAKDGILILDAETGMIVDVNPFLIEMLGFSHEQFMGKAIWEISPFKDIASNKEKFMELQRKEYVRYEDLPLETTDGRQIEVEFVSNVYTVDHASVIQCNIRDITERKRLEEELKSNIEMKSKFTSMVSHELRSPLGAIKEGINLVLEGLAGDINNEQMDLLDTAKRNTDRLGRLINNVLDFQKMESGKMGFDIRENDINEVVLEVNKAMSLLAKEKGLDLAVHLDDSMPKIKLDRDKIIQVLTNLVSNAMKYTEKGNITISTKQEDHVVHVIVQDTGRGIKAEDMQKLFQAFEQLDSTKDKEKGGTGLGLAISKEIILAHKGKIWAESEPGKGSSLHFILPIKERRLV